MFETAFSTVTDLFDKRFLTSIYLPCLVICSIFVALLIHTNGLNPVIQLWDTNQLEIQALIIVFYLLLIYLISYILSIYLNNIIRLYEGYWNDYFDIFSWDITNNWVINILRLMVKFFYDIIYLIYDITIINFYKWKKSQYLFKYKDMKEYIKKNGYDQKSIPFIDKLYFFYPDSNKFERYIMPTKLGNILKSSEIYPKERYNIDSVLIWPRLYPLLPESYRYIVAECKSELESMLIISFLGIIYSIITGIYLIINHHSWHLVIINFLGGLFLWWLAYHSAIKAALVLSESYKSTYDTYRGCLFKEMGYELPTSLDDEKEKWEKICQFMIFNQPIDIPYLEKAKICDEDSTWYR